MMERTASINLDLARWLAAMAVFSTHFFQQGTDGTYRTEVEPLGRLGVVFFFVLSGYVISATALKKHTDMVSYTAARLGRLHSVLIPAMALTWVADLIRPRLAPEPYLHPLFFMAMPPFSHDRLDGMPPAVKDHRVQ